MFQMIRAISITIKYSPILNINITHARYLYDFFNRSTRLRQPVHPVYKVFADLLVRRVQGSTRGIHESL